MRRRAFNVLSAISLLMCLATAGLWVRSYWRCDWLTYSAKLAADRQQDRDLLYSQYGVVRFEHATGGWNPAINGYPADIGFKASSISVVDPRLLASVSLNGFGFMGLAYFHHVD